MDKTRTNGSKNGATPRWRRPKEKKNYTATYRAIKEAIHAQLRTDYTWLIRAHILLRQHGKELCKTNAPLCEKCPVRKSCAYFESAFG